MRLNYDPKAAVSEIQAKVASQRNQLPADAEDPVIDARTGDPTALMYLAFYSRQMSLSQISDYLLRVVQPQIQALPGVAKAALIGNKTFAMRIWLDPARMAALGVSATRVEDVLRTNNYLAGVGQTKGPYVAVDLAANTDVSRLEDFERLVVESRNGSLVRLEDIADVELGAEDYDTTTMYKGIPAIFVGIEQAPGQNPLTVAKRVHDLLPELRAQFPSGLEAHIPYDASQFIEDSIREVFQTLAEAVLIVLLVIFLTLGSLRAALVPAVAVPLSLIGGAFIMLLLGYSINLLTLLAMVLAIGLVVDDAIVVVENVHRHIEMGKPRVQAALDGARELGLPIIAMTTTLVAVYAPIGFMGGLVGTLFSEFAFSLAGRGAGVRGRGAHPVAHAELAGAQARRRPGPLRARGRALLPLARRGLPADPPRQSPDPVRDPGIRRRGADQHLLHVRHQPQRAGAHRRPEHPVLPRRRPPDRYRRIQSGLCPGGARHLRKCSRVPGELRAGGLSGRPHGDLRRLQDAAAKPARALPDGDPARTPGQAAASGRVPDRRLPPPQPAGHRARPAVPTGAGLRRRLRRTRRPGRPTHRQGHGQRQLHVPAQEHRRCAPAHPDRDRPRPRRRLGYRHARDRPQPVGTGGRRLRQPLQPGRAQLQGDPPGGTGIPPRPGDAERLLRANRRRRAGTAGQPGALLSQRGTQPAHPVPAAQLDQCRGRHGPGGDPGRRPGLPRGRSQKTVASRT